MPKQQCRAVYLQEEEAIQRVIRCLDAYSANMPGKKINIKAWSRSEGVDYQKLRYRWLHIRGNRFDRRPSHTRLTPPQADALAQFCRDRARLDMPIPPKCVRDIAGRLIRRGLRSDQPYVPVSKKWAARFVRKHRLNDVVAEVRGPGRGEPYESRVSHCFFRRIDRGVELGPFDDDQPHTDEEPGADDAAGAARVRVAAPAACLPPPVGYAPPPPVNVFGEQVREPSARPLTLPPEPPSQPQPFLLDPNLVQYCRPFL